MPQTAKKITTPNGDIEFLEYIPSGIPTNLTIFLHGQGERKNIGNTVQAVTQNGIPNYCAKGTFPYNHIVLSPQLDGKFGNWQLWYIDEMLNYALNTLKYTGKFICLTGLSLGGGGTWHYATDGSQRAKFTHFAPICGTDEFTPEKLCTVPNFWAFHCINDSTVPVGATQKAEGWVYECKSINKKFTYYLSGGHEGAWLNAYDTGHITRALKDGTQFFHNPNLYEWMENLPAQDTQPAPNTFTKAIFKSTISGNTVTVDPIGSTGNGGISSFYWETFDTSLKYFKPNSLTGVQSANNISPTNVTFTFPNGNYIVKLTVQDKYGRKESYSEGVSFPSGVVTNPTTSTTTTTTTTQPPVDEVIAKYDLTIYKSGISTLIKTK